MLLVHLFPSVVTETRCSRIPTTRRTCDGAPSFLNHKCGAERHAGTINESQSADTRIPAVLKGYLVGNCGKQLQSDVLK
jgi:hypothetical protein